MTNRLSPSFFKATGRNDPDVEPAIEHFSGEKELCYYTGTSGRI
jgi:hypothetical protein